MTGRPTPFALVFGALAPERFPALRDSLAARGTDPADRDAFVLDPAVAQLLRDIVPEEAPPEALAEFLATLHHGYLFWQGGQVVVAGTSEAPRAPRASPAPLAPLYLQLPSHLYWGQLEPEAPHEPLDGLFVHPHGGALRALGVFGVHPERPGFSVVEVAGPPPAALLPRADGSAPFAPQMAGGAAAGIRSVAGPDELLALAWHTPAAHG